MSYDHAIERAATAMLAAQTVDAARAAMARLLRDVVAGTLAQPPTAADAGPPLTRQQAAERSGVHIETICLWCHSGLGRWDDNARRWLIPPAELDARLQQRRDRLKKRR